MDESSVASWIAAVRSGDAGTVAEMLRLKPELIGARPQEGPSVLLLAVYHGHGEVARFLVGEGSPVGIFEAAALGLLERAEALLVADASLANAVNVDGFQPLGLAAFFGHEPLVRLLLERGAEVDSASRNAQQVRPLHSAVAAGSAGITRLLIAWGADVDAVQQGGFTPLHAAAQAGHAEIVELLLEAGADPSVLAGNGRSAVEMAREANHGGVAERLEAATAVVR